MWSVLLQYYSVPPSSSPVRLRTTKFFCSTTPYYNVLLQYYSSTTPYYNVLLQYCSVPKRTTPGLLSTRKYYSSTTLYYKVLLQYCSVLTAMQLEEPGAATSQGEVFLTVDLGCPSFEYLVTSFTTSFIPRSRPCSPSFQKNMFPAISKQFALNMIVWLKD